jgi:hypothetical protein
MNINEYVNMNLDKNDMSTTIGTLQNPYQDQTGTQMMDNLIQQMEQMPQTQPKVISGQQIQGQQQLPMSGQQLPMSGQQQQLPMSVQQQQLPMPVQQQQLPMPVQQQQLPMQGQQMPLPNQSNQNQVFMTNQQFQSSSNKHTKTNLEKEKVMKELEISSSESSKSKEDDIKNIIPLDKSVEIKEKTLISHINETIMVVLLFILITNPFIGPLCIKYIPFFEMYPLALFGTKILLFGLIYHLARWLL